MNKLIVSLLLMAGIAQAQTPPPISYTIEADYQQTQSLADQSFQQGAGVSLRYKLMSNGSYLSLTNLTGKWQGRASVTSTSYITQVTATTVTNVTPNYFQFDLDYTATGTAVTNWVYSMITTYASNDYVMGEGRLDIRASSWTGSGQALNSGEYVSKLVAGSGITLSPTTGVGEVTITSTGSGVTSHPLLTELDYTNSGHTGFQPAIAGTVLTNGGNASLSITIPDATQTNQPATFGQLKEYAQASSAFFFTTNKTTYFQSWGFTPTNATYRAAVTAAVNQGSINIADTGPTQNYFFAEVFTNFTVSFLNGGVASVEIWASESSPGNMIFKPEGYLIDSVNSNIVEAADFGSVITVVGTTPTRYTASIPYNSFETNHPCYLALKLKSDTTSANKNLTIYTGNGTASHFELPIPVDVFTANKAEKSTTVTVNGASGTLASNLVFAVKAAAIGDFQPAVSNNVTVAGALQRSGGTMYLTSPFRIDAENPYSPLLFEVSASPRQVNVGADFGMGGFGITNILYLQFANGMTASNGVINGTNSWVYSLNGTNAHLRLPW